MHGTAGFVLANGSMSSSTSGEGAIRQKIIENDLVDCMIALPGQLFYTTQIPVCLWFISKNKREDKARGYRNRQGETLFIDAREMGSMISRVHKELTADDIAKIANTYHAWRQDKQFIEQALAEQLDDTPTQELLQEHKQLNAYEDVAGFCKSATLDEIKANDYVLTPGRYVGAAAIEDDGVPFEVKMRELSQTLLSQMDESERLDNAIRQNLAELGYGE